MRRASRLGLIVAILLLVVVLGGYTVFWFIAAGRIEDALAEQAQALRAQRLDLSWKAIAVSGYPFDFHVALDEVSLQGPAGEVRLPQLLGDTNPSDFHRWSLTAPKGLTASGSAAGRLTARAARGTVSAGGDGGATIWLSLDKPDLELGLRFAAQDADIWLSLPAHPPQQHGDPMLGLAADLRDVALPTVPAPFKNPLDEIALGTTVNGAIPAGPAKLAAAAWRDAGGTLELDHLTARWGSLAITGSGTVALDRDLQPEGAFSGGVEGYDQLMAALVAAGKMRASDAGLARLALTMLARAGPNGRPQVPVSFTIQDGQMQLGPIRLGPAPKIRWE